MEYNSYFIIFDVSELHDKMPLWNVLFPDKPSNTLTWYPVVF